MKDRISIIIPIYRVEKYLRQCLDSVVNQTYNNLEIILVNDGSPDSCGNICDEYAEEDERIIVIHKENAGVSAARNDGIEHATGEWVMFVDPDDWLEVDCCKCALEAADQTDGDMLYFQREINDEYGSTLKTFPTLISRILNSNDLHKIQLDTLAGDAESFGFESGTPWGKLYRRSFLMEHSCKFPVGVKKRQDVLFNLQCLEYIQSAYYLDYVGYHYRQSENSICRGYNRNMLDVLLDFYAKTEQFVIEYHKDDEYFGRMLGVLAIRLQGDLRSTMFFNAAGFMPVNEYLNYMEVFYANPVVEKYINKPKFLDFHGLKEKVYYVLISRHHVYLYYLICTIAKRFKQSVNRRNRSKRSKRRSHMQGA